MQFHPEVTHTKQGAAILSRASRTTSAAAATTGTCTTTSAKRSRAIRAQVGSDDVILGLSGGVDSSVAAALIHRAIGDRLTCVFVDHGLLRLNEAEQVMDTFAQQPRRQGDPRRCRRASSCAALAGVDRSRSASARSSAARSSTCSSARRRSSRNVKWLAQGTIYPDVIESAGAKTKKAHTIKSHHNVGGLPETLHLKLLEPLRELFKDEVRELGLRARPAARDGLPPSVPGPGPRRAHPAAR